MRGDCGFHYEKINFLCGGEQSVCIIESVCAVAQNGERALLAVRLGIVLVLALPFRGFGMQSEYTADE